LAPGLTPALELVAPAGRVDADVAGGGPGHLLVETSSGRVHVAGG
jgi:hypothetical protein